MNYILSFSMIATALSKDIVMYSLAGDELKLTFPDLLDDENPTDKQLKNEIAMSIKADLYDIVILGEQYIIRSRTRHPYDVKLIFRSLGIIQTAAEGIIKLPKIVIIHQ